MQKILAKLKIIAQTLNPVPRNNVGPPPLNSELYTIKEEFEELVWLIKKLGETVALEPIDQSPFAEFFQIQNTPNRKSILAHFKNKNLAPKNEAINKSSLPFKLCFNGDIKNY